MAWVIDIHRKPCLFWGKGKGLGWGGKRKGLGEEEGGEGGANDWGGKRKAAMQSRTVQRAR